MTKQNHIFWHFCTFLIHPPGDYSRHYSWCLTFRPKSSIFVSSDQRILFLMVWESLGTFWKTQRGLSYAIYWGVASVWPLYNKGLICVVLQRCPSGSFSHLHEEVWSSVRVTIGFLVTSLTKALLPRYLSLAGRTALGRVLVVPNFFHLRMMEATVFLGTFNAADIFWYPSPDLCLSKNSFNLMAWFLLWYCTVNCGTLYRQMCAFPNHIQSIEFTTGWLQSSNRNISCMINGNRMHLRSISSLSSKGLNTFVNKVFLFFICNYLAKMY